MSGTNKPNRTQTYAVATSKMPLDLFNLVEQFRASEKITTRNETIIILVTAGLQKLGFLDDDKTLTNIEERC